MRLIDSKTLCMSNFSNSEIPKYAILSHRWTSDEVGFNKFRKAFRQDFGHNASRYQEGFVKIQRCCDEALAHGFKWVWIDTCCINKDSSSELTEAINSMYDWYKRADICFVYLSDVAWETDTPDMQYASMSQFRQSSWFTRGWTLQELLAPANVRFYDQDWRFIGTKQELVQDISGITGIDVKYLLEHGRDDVETPCISSVECRGHSAPVRYWDGRRGEPSVATRMSWASRRRTTRIEDMAYCLLGIFKVNMPLLYGEKQRAFTRLQREIIKSNSDDSIFAWTTESYGTGILARWPTDFVQSRYVYEQGPIMTHREPYTLTNQGLRLPLAYAIWDPRTKILNVLLDCGVCGPAGFKNIVLRLKRSGKLWNRVDSYQIATVDQSPEFYSPGLPWDIPEQKPEIEDTAQAAPTVKTIKVAIIVQAEWSIGYGNPQPPRNSLLGKL